MMTFRELRELVPVADKRKTVISAKSLLDSEIPIVVREILPGGDRTPEIRITVYANGYVVYQNGKHLTYFPLHSCGAYTYEAVADCERRNRITRDAFDNEKWYIRLMLEGEDRMTHNYESRVGKKTVSYSAVAEDWVVMGVEELMFNLPEPEKSMEELMQMLIDLLTENQFYIIQKFCFEKVGQKELAEELGVSTQAISDTVSKARRKIQRAFGVTLRKKRG